MTISELIDVLLLAKKSSFVFTNHRLLLEDLLNVLSWRLFNQGLRLILNRESLT